MPAAVTLVLLVFWLVLAYRQFQRGDLVLAAVFLLVGIVLTVYRLRLVAKRVEQVGPGTPKGP
jgi:hypothetical protein